MACRLGKVGGKNKMMLDHETLDKANQLKKVNKKAGKWFGNCSQQMPYLILTSVKYC